MKAKKPIPETRIMDSQMRWIAKHYGLKAANKANYGRVVDGYGYLTKVYGHGYLITNMRTGKHYWKEM